jgi:hypothetical protein
MFAGVARKINCLAKNSKTMTVAATYKEKGGRVLFLLE